MKVLQVHTHYRQRGGEDAVVAAEAQLLRAAGHDVVQHLAANPEKPMATAAALAAAPYNLRAAQAVAAQAVAVRPDVAHVHNTWFALSPAVVAALHRRDIPVVATLHNYRLVCSAATLFRDGHPCEECVGSHPWHGVQHRCYRDSAVASTSAAATIAANRRTWRDGVDVFLALTEFARCRFIAGGLPADKVIVRPNFTQDPGGRTRPAADADEVLVVGRLSQEKGVDVVLRAWAAARLPYQLTVIGDGPQRDALHALAPSGVRFLGAIPPEQVVQHMRGARALLFGSQWYEGMPVSMLEAMAAGLPTLAADLGAMAEMQRDAPRWLVTPPDDAQAWRQALQVLSDPAAVANESARARRQYEAHHTPGAALRSLEGAYAAAQAMRL